MGPVQAQFFLDHFEGDVFSRFSQGGAGVFQVQAVHFLASQALQQTEVFNRDHGGHVFPTGGYGPPPGRDTGTLCP